MQIIRNTDPLTLLIREECPMPLFRFRRAALLAVSLSLSLSLSLSAVVPALAGEDEQVLVLRNHRFEPDELTVPAGRRFTLVVRNLDSTGDEFESHDLKLEKRIGANAEIRLKLGPLQPGSYGFVGEQHEDTAKGTISVK
ncbi:MAG: cupredoxin domain-containing protein [Rhodospirillaceae bacterium]